MSLTHTIAVDKLQASIRQVVAGFGSSPHEVAAVTNNLIEALERDTLGGAGLDVFESEPNVPERLRALPQVVLSPHIGSATGQTRQAMADLAFANLSAHFAGRPLPSPVPECR